MKRFLSAILALTMILSVSGCISSGGGGGGDSSAASGGGSPALPDKSDVTLFFDLGDMLAMNNADKDIMLAKIIDIITMAETAYATPLYDYATALYIKVTGPGMADIEYAQDISDITESFSVTLTIPNGPDRTFYVELKDRNEFVLYSGTIIIDVGDYQGTPQDITIDVSLTGEINAEDYIEIGRGYLEDYKLELAFIAFDTAVGMDADHPVACFFRGFTRLLLLIQKDDPDADVTSPNSNIVSVLNLYAGINVYSDTIVPIFDPDDPDKNLLPYNIIPDIYDTDEPGLNEPGFEDEGYDDKFKNFCNKDWVRPQNMLTGEGVDLIENVMLPEIDNVINDLANAETDAVFYTTLTTSMYFDILSEIKVDRADIYILGAIAYGLKAYYNHILAYQLRTDIDYWADEFAKEYPDYIGLQNIINGRPAKEVGKLVVGSVTYLGNAREAYSSGLDKLKSGLQFIDGRSLINKEGHLFDIAGADVDIPAITATIDEIKAALNGPADINFENDIARLDLSKLFLTPDINSLPEFYYHATSGEDLPIFNTNDPAPIFDPSLGGVIIEVNGRNINDGVNDIEDALREDILPMGYKFNVPIMTITMSGNSTDFTDSGLRPVMVDEEESSKAEWRDLTDVYMARDNDYLYIGMKFRGTPYNRTALLPGEWINYNLFFNAKYSDCNWYGCPVIIQLYGTSTGWSFDLYSYGSAEPVVSYLEEYGCSYDVSGDTVEFKIPLDRIAQWIGNYQWVAPEETWNWDGKEAFVAVSFWSRVSYDDGDYAGECLSELNIEIGE